VQILVSDRGAGRAREYEVVVLGVTCLEAPSPRAAALGEIVGPPPLPVSLDVSSTGLGLRATELKATLHRDEGLAYPDGATPEIQVLDQPVGLPIPEAYAALARQNADQEHDQHPPYQVEQRFTPSSLRDL